jgi:hypothetical protein
VCSLQLQLPRAAGRRWAGPSPSCARSCGLWKLAGLPGLGAASLAPWARSLGPEAAIAVGFSSARKIYPAIGLSWVSDFHRAIIAALGLRSHHSEQTSPSAKSLGFSTSAAVRDVAPTAEAGAKAQRTPSLAAAIEAQTLPASHSRGFFETEGCSWQEPSSGRPRLGPAPGHSELRSRLLGLKPGVPTAEAGPRRG